ncbi:unnamed protein product [Notodromas monacha]|uniref:NadR/Ttd14 AAA domain-containing protein n=1 Tax=Notodromas monacha TaxID=399045 RepID=A0A7R9GIW9_9CRUS|nr:unnamed protein product [Notodromas monacha]CAG0923032.1 unnamed protein product [Notodromas monacha]
MSCVVVEVSRNGILCFGHEGILRRRAEDMLLRVRQPLKGVYTVHCWMRGEPLRFGNPAGFRARLTDTVVYKSMEGENHFLSAENEFPTGCRLSSPGLSTQDIPVPNSCAGQIILRRGSGSDEGSFPLWVELVRSLQVACNMDDSAQNKNKYATADFARSIYKVVLTGGPCGGKTTGQSRLSSFFENLGWKVFRVPEAANTLLSGGVKFTDLSREGAFNFQENLLKTMLQIEQTFFTLAENISNKNVLVICDRGAMDPNIDENSWQEILCRNGLNPVSLRDNRYNQIIHMVTAADGAEAFYTTEEHQSRDETTELARQLDRLVSEAWVGHPYFDVIDNSTDFETKVKRMINKGAVKLKFLVKAPLPPDVIFPPFQDFEVVHDYLTSGFADQQIRLRKRGQNGYWSYTHTCRKPRVEGQIVEIRQNISHRDYVNLLAQKSLYHVSVFKRRRCFVYKNQYFQMDIYKEPCHPRCKGLIFLETYSTLSGSELLSSSLLPDFLSIVKEVTGDPCFSMYNLSLKDDWRKTDQFCNGLTGSSELSE